MSTNHTKARSYSREQLEEIVGSAGYWWHSIDLGQGVVTPGEKSTHLLQRELAYLDGLDLSGKSVLDIGAYDGFFSFEAERRGAGRVVALDHYVWSLDLPSHIRYWRECRARGTTPLQAEQTPHWRPAELPGRRAFDIARQVLESRVEPVVGDFMTMNLEPLGTFDVVFFMGVLYHMQDPIGALRRLASVTRGVAVIETHAVRVPGYENREICEFYSANQLNADVSNWWGPNMRALEGMCLAAGFGRTTVRSNYWGTVGLGHAPRSRCLEAARFLKRLLMVLRPFRRRPLHFRAALHAWKE